MKQTWFESWWVIHQPLYQKSSLVSLNQSQIITDHSDAAQVLARTLLRVHCQLQWQLQDVLLKAAEQTQLDTYGDF